MVEVGRGRHPRRPSTAPRPIEAAAIVLVDRAISVLSIIVLGSIAYVLSAKTRVRLRRLRGAPSEGVVTGAGRRLTAGARRGFRGRQPASSSAAVVRQLRLSSVGATAAHDGSTGWRDGQPAHPEGEVVLHHLADLWLVEEVVGAQRVLDARGGVARGRATRPKYAACRPRHGARAARGRAWWRCRGRACGRRARAGRSWSGRRPTAGPAGAATSSWP